MIIWILQPCLFHYFKSCISFNYSFPLEYKPYQLICGNSLYINGIVGQLVWKGSLVRFENTCQKSKKTLAVWQELASIWQDFTNGRLDLHKDFQYFTMAFMFSQVSMALIATSSSSTHLIGQTVSNTNETCLSLFYHTRLVQIKVTKGINIVRTDISTPRKKSALPFLSTPSKKHFRPPLPQLKFKSQVNHT